MEVNDGNQAPLEKGFRAAVLIKRIDGEQFHTGILYHTDSVPEPEMLHLAWHTVLRNHSWNKTYKWITPAVHPKRTRQVAGMCRLVLEGNPDGLPYAFSNPDESFDLTTGKYLLGPTKLGLTCATFVLAIYSASGLPLIKLGEWPVGRVGDAEWQQYIVDQLKATGAPDEHIEAVANDVGCIRIRPTEVAAASSIAPPEVAHSDIAELDAQLCAMI